LFLSFANLGLDSRLPQWRDPQNVCSLTARDCLIPLSSQ